MPYTCIVNKVAIITPKEFSFELAYSFLARSPYELLHRVEDGKVFKALYVDSKKILFAIQQDKADLQIEFLKSSSIRNQKKSMSSNMFMNGSICTPT